MFERRCLILFVSLILSVVLLVSCAASSGTNPPETDPSAGGGTSETADSASSSSPAESEPEQTEPSGPESEDPKPVYTPPEDGSFTICGIDLSEYAPMLYFTGSGEYARLNRPSITRGIEKSALSALGLEWSIKVIKVDKYLTERRSDHEILFGKEFRREGIPEYDSSRSCYGVTADGTVYFQSPSPMLYPYMWRLFLEEFMGVPVGSESMSLGCAVTECYREVPTLNHAELEREGYALVFEDEFQGEDLDWDVWRFRMGGQAVDFNERSLVRLEDGILFLAGDYLADGSAGAGWYGSAVALNQRYARGVFEAKIRCSEAPDGRYGRYWTAFWLQGPNPYVDDLSQGGAGPGGTEIDILENFGPDYHTSNFWVSGVENKKGIAGKDNLSNELYEVYNLGYDYAKEFHTYTLIWDEEFYRIYIDGLLIACTDFYSGTSPAEEEVVLSLECQNTQGEPPETAGSGRVEMAVDYLRIWQKSAE
ncbi:MAG: glycoside hydrolase family 16 protein [Clostridia bacterium]|nr:glycoside hydrolase family 16 protein [Clostridia bacterium]